MLERQTTSQVLMIRPVDFAANDQTAASNRFQQSGGDDISVSYQARLEFDDLVFAIREAGVDVCVFEGAATPHTPDAVFPNNWVSFHSDGTAVLYPMLAANRRLERRKDILDSLVAKHRFILRQTIDLTHHENQCQYLEGTGSLVLDRVNHVAYACSSPRTNAKALKEFAQRLNYKIVLFEAVDRTGVPIYHTNVLLSVGTNYAAICLDAILPMYRDIVRDALHTTHHHLVELSHEQVSDFAGNMLELNTADGAQIIALSSRAEQALTPKQRGQLVNWAGRLISAPIPTIETIGGGSVRCMIAEIHLPIAANS